jgi:hypothetical protein
MRVLPDAAPESVQANVTSFEEKDVDSGPLLTLDLATDDPSVGLKSVIDPVTLDEIFAPVPSGYTSALSSDGHWWLLINQSPTPNGQTYRLIEARTGAEEDFQTPGPTFFPQWRPGRAEIWASINQYGDAPVTWIKRPGEPLASIPTGRTGTGARRGARRGAPRCSSASPTIRPPRSFASTRTAATSRSRSSWPMGDT